MAECKQQNEQIHHQHRKHQKVPLVFVQGTPSKMQKPLRFGEPLLDALGEYIEHECMVNIKELIPSNAKTKTNIIIMRRNKGQNSSIPMLDNLIHTFDGVNAPLGQSNFSPVRRLKEYILNEINVKSQPNKPSHDVFLQNLPKYCDKNVFPKLATVIILMDCDQNILLTRRHSKLRSFPSCFVVPGGSVDEDESMQDAAKRELMEEVGIDIKNMNDENMKMVAIWESIFPDTKTFDVVNNKTIKYHHIMCIYVYQLKENYTNYQLKLCAVEVDAAVWINAKKLRAIIDSDEDIGGELDGITPSGTIIKIKLECLKGIYPNEIGQGIARGHRYGIIKLLDSLKEKTSESSKL